MLTDPNRNPNYKYFQRNSNLSGTAQFEDEMRQLAPIENLLKSGQYRDIPNAAGLISDVRSGKLSIEEGVSKITGSPIFNPNIGPQINTGQGYRPQTGQDLMNIKSPLSINPEAKSIADSINTQVLGGFPQLASGGLETRKGLQMPTLSEKPALPSAIAQTTSLISQYVNPAEGQLSTAKEELANVQNTIISEQDKIKGQLVSSRVMGKQLVKLNQEMAEGLRVAEAKVSASADRVNTQYKMVSMLQDAYKWDYQESQRAYEFEYNKAYQFISLVVGQQKEERNDAQAQVTAFINLAKGNPKMLDSVESSFFSGLDAKAGYQNGWTEGLSRIASQIPNYQFNTVGSKETGYSVIAIDENTQDIKVFKAVGGTGPGVSNPLTAEDLIKKYPNLPPSLARASEDQIWADLNSGTAPSWYKEVIGREVVGPLSLKNIKDIDDQWEIFRKVAIDEVKAQLQKKTEEGGGA